MADHTKWGVVGLSTTVGLNRADVLITDPGLSPEVHEMLSSLVGELIVASPETTEGVSSGRAGAHARD